MVRSDDGVGVYSNIGVNLSSLVGKNFYQRFWGVFEFSCPFLIFGSLKTLSLSLLG